VIENIAYHRGRNDEKPNIELAETLVKRNDTKGIAEIAKGLGDEKAQVASDCVKVLYEIGYRKPELITGYADLFVNGLRSMNNRLVWGSCIALSLIAEPASDYLFKEFDTIYKAYENGSVITRDNCVSIFAGMARAGKKYSKKLFPVLVEHLRNCRPKEVGQHAERAFVCVNGDNAAEFRSVLEKRIGSLADPQRKRVERLFSKIEKGEFA
jgi:hypothetical protein